MYEIDILKEMYIFETVMSGMYFDWNLKKSSPAPYYHEPTIIAPFLIGQASLYASFVPRSLLDRSFVAGRHSLDTRSFTTEILQQDLLIRRQIWNEMTRAPKRVENGPRPWDGRSNRCPNLYRWRRRHQADRLTSKRRLHHCVGPWSREFFAAGCLSRSRSVLLLYFERCIRTDSSWISYRDFVPTATSDSVNPSFNRHETRRTWCDSWRLNESENGE